MAAKDRYHRAVKNALISDGWTITHDPLQLKYGKVDLYADLAAEQFFAAQKLDRYIAVEVKSFAGESQIADLEQAFGQFMLYYKILRESEPYRMLYLGITENTYEELFTQPIGRLLTDDGSLRLLVVDFQSERIVRWLP
jgi:hypothetical protein